MKMAVRVLEFFLDHPIRRLMTVAAVGAATIVLSWKWAGFGLNFAAEAFGLFFAAILTVTVVNELQERREKRRWSFFRHQLAELMQGFITMLFVCHKGWAESKGIEEDFKPDYLTREGAQQLFNHLAWHCEMFQDKARYENLIKQVEHVPFWLERYLLFFPPDSELGSLMFQWFEWWWFYKSGHLSAIADLGSRTLKILDAVEGW
jgi:hypothetical protein